MLQKGSPFHNGSMKYAGMVELGSDASAAGGGSSELSAWPRSARDEGGSAEDIRRAPQQEDSVDLGNVTLGKVFSRCHCKIVGANCVRPLAVTDRPYKW